MDKFVNVTVEEREYTDIVHHHKRMDPATEVLLYGDELKNDMRVLSTELVNVDSTSQLQLMTYRNRWATVKRLRKVDSGIYFILKYDDGDMVIRQTAQVSAWWVTKESVEAVELFERMQAEQRADDEVDNDGTPVNGVAYDADAEQPDKTCNFGPREELVERHGDPDAKANPHIEGHDEPVQTVGGVFEV